jgi:hypothetical protein
VEAFTDRIIRVSERELERLRDIVGVHMVHGLHPFVREPQQLAASKAGKNVRIEMPGRIQRIPPGTHQVSRMQYHRTGNAAPSAVEQKLFDSGLLDSVITERMSRIRFRRRYNGRAPVHPHCAAMEQERLARL